MRTEESDDNKKRHAHQDSSQMNSPMIAAARALRGWTAESEALSVYHAMMKLTATPAKKGTIVPFVSGVFPGLFIGLGGLGGYALGYQYGIRRLRRTMVKRMTYSDLQQRRISNYRRRRRVSLSIRLSPSTFSYINSVARIRVVHKDDLM